MFDLFLVCDQDLFELSVRGRIEDPITIGHVTDALDLLPAGCDAVLDLSVTEAMSTDACRALVEALDRRVDAAGRWTVVVGEPAIRASFEEAGLTEVFPLVATLQAARQAVASVHVGA